MKRQFALLAFASVSLGVSAQPLKLHVPSPDWRDQIIYFAMTDRFDDGNPKNNDQGAGEYKPGSKDHFNGGDLAGLLRRLDYIQGLGATALWLTPPNRNQWHDPLLGFYGYHGYWAQHFKQVDPHFGTLADYRALSSALHRRGMVLVQDIVVNHVGNYFDYAGGWDAKDPTRFYTPNPKSKPSPRPTQAPFHLNDPRRARDRTAGIYHWTPPLIELKERANELNWQMSGLDDLNTENPVVRRALRDSFAYWIREVGVDAFRVDTAFYVPELFFDDFMNAKDRRAPGMREAARRTGRKDFLVFGEGFGIDQPGEEVLTRRIEAYVSGPKGERLMDGMLNFPLYGALVDVFARGAAPSVLADRVQRMMRVHSDPHRMPSFVDNHDVDRWLAGGTERGLEQALLSIMALPGIPVLYYGTEQGFTEQRAAMFAAGYASGGRDRFDTTAPLYRRIAGLTALRRSEPVFSRGVPTMLHASAAGQGAVAWRMSHQGQHALVMINTAKTPMLVDNLDSGLPAGSVLSGRYGLDGMPSTLRVGAGGRLNLVLPPQAGWVWVSGGQTTDIAPSPGMAPSLDPLPAAPATADFEVSGQAQAGQRVQVVVDGDLERASVAVADAQGRFKARISTLRMSDPAVPHRLVAYVDGQASAAQSFRVALPWRVLADVADPAGDDRGPDGSYRYPTHSSFVDGQMDLTRVRVLGAGGNLRVELTMREFSTVWGPPNGFDHVAFTIFVELPGRSGGAHVMPLQFAKVPGGMRWHLRLRAHGWSNAIFSDQGASAGDDGEPVKPAALISSDKQARTVRFQIPSATLGDPATLSGIRVYINTWDYDGGYRTLAAEPAPYTMGSRSTANPERGARVMDDTVVIRLP
jgi:glycosidase